MDLFQAKLLHVGRLPPDPLWQLPAHSHPYDELIVIIGGTLPVRLNGTELHARCGELLLYPANVSHAEVSDARRPCETYFLSLEWPQRPPSLPLHQTDRHGRITHLVSWLYEERE